MLSKSLSKSLSDKPSTLQAIYESLVLQGSVVRSTLSTQEQTNFLSSINASTRRRLYLLNETNRREIIEKPETMGKSLGSMMLTNTGVIKNLTRTVASGSSLNKSVYASLPKSRQSTIRKTLVGSLPKSLTKSVQARLAKTNNIGELLNYSALYGSVRNTLNNSKQETFLRAFSTLTRSQQQAVTQYLTGTNNSSRKEVIAAIANSKVMKRSLSTLASTVSTVKGLSNTNKASTVGTNIAKTLPSLETVKEAILLGGRLTEDPRGSGGLPVRLRKNLQEKLIKSFKAPI
jgi:hypothetical protein